LTTISPHTTRANGTVLTATIYNADHVNHITNATALNNGKVESATPPVVDGHGVIFDGTSGSGIRSSGGVPLLGPTLAIGAGGTGQTTASAAFGALKQTADETNTGVIDLATDAEIRAATTGAHAIMASDLESAAALVTLTDDATIAVDWDTFINSIVTMAGNRTLGNPTNLQAATWRTIWIQGNDGTDRTITLSGNYLGPSVAVWNALTFNSSTKRYIMSIYALNGVSAVLVAPPLGPF
jgi:hypothetical protein